MEIYMQFDDISQIVALNSTSRRFYEIWRLDPARISAAVLPRSIDYYDATVKIQEAEERQQKLDPHRRCDPFKTPQHLLPDCLSTSSVSTDKAAYAATLARNEHLIRIADKADLLPTLCKPASINSLGRERIVHAFYRIWQLTIRNSRNFDQHKISLLRASVHGDDRDPYLRALDLDLLYDMARLVRFLVFECPGKELVRLGVSTVFSGGNPAESPTTCLVGCHWMSELIRVGTWANDGGTVFYLLLTKKSLLYKDC